MENYIHEKDFIFMEDKEIPMKRMVTPDNTDFYPDIIYFINEMNLNEEKD